MHTINVIKGFDGLRGEFVDTIQRKGVQIRYASKRGQRGTPQAGQYRVSYRGKTYITFALSGNYGELNGLCIDIQD